MFPLIGLAIQYVPELIHLIAGDKAGNVASAVTQAVTAVTQTSDPAAAAQMLQGNSAAAADLRTRLAQIAVDAQKAQNEEADKRRQDELASMQANIGNTENARGNMLALAQAHSSAAWGAPVVSVVVTLGFFFSIALLIFRNNTFTNTNGDFVGQIINISFGTLATAFATVINFWLGSSQGSKTKDIAALQSQQTQSAQIDSVLAHADSVTSSVMASMRGPQPDTVKPAGAPTDHFDRCVAVTLAMEGGFTNDVGGPTNFGITQRTLAAFAGHDVTEDDVRSLTSAQAIEIYRANYWNQMRCGDLPAGVDMMVFDYGVNSGPGRAVGDLQKLVGVPQDGAIGKQTLGAVAKATPATLVNELADARLVFLKTLGNFDKYGAGWTSRVAQVQAAAVKMLG